MFIDSKERERGKKKKTVMWEENVYASCVHPARDLTLNPGMCPDWELNPQTSWCTRQCSNELSHLARAYHALFTNKETKSRETEGKKPGLRSFIFGRCSAPWEHALTFPFPLSFPLRRASPKLSGSTPDLQPGEQWAAAACPGLTPGARLQGPLSLTFEWAKATPPGLSPAASSVLSSSLFHCLQL